MGELVAKVIIIHLIIRGNPKKLLTSYKLAGDAKMAADSMEFKDRGSFGRT